MSDDWSFRPDLKGVSRNAFEIAGQREFFSRDVDSRRASRAASIHWKADQLITRAKEHHEQMRPKFMEREYQKLRLEQAQPPQRDLSQGPQGPFDGRMKEFAREKALRSQAEANVDGRHSLRLHTIRAIESRMERNLTRDRPRTR